MSPYGMMNETPKTTQWLENCVKKVMRDGKDKSSAIAICKSTFEKMHGPDGKAALEIYPIIQDLRKNNMTYLIQDVEEYFHSPEQE